jgi:FG-GAP-like repeat
MRRLRLISRVRLGECSVGSDSRVRLAAISGKRVVLTPVQLSRSRPLVVLAALLAGLSATALAASPPEPRFSRPMRYDPPGCSIASIAVSDLNHDGRSDVVVGTTGTPPEISGETSVLLAGRRGRLSGPRPLGFAATGGVAAGDFDGDGNRDVVRASTDELLTPGGVVQRGKYALLFGDGRGGFGAPVATPTECCAAFVTVGDFNRDGRRDLVLSGSETGGPRVLFGDGTGRFPIARELKIEFAGRVVVADLNRDRKQDLAVLTGTDVAGPLYLLFGDGRGGFSRRKPLRTSEDTVGALAVGRFNRDRWPDLAASTSLEENQVEVWLGVDGRRFRRVATYGRHQLGDIVAADFNRDRRQDLAVPRVVEGPIGAGSSVRVRLGAGGGRFRAARRILRCSYGCSSLWVGFFNRDRKPDLATLSGGNLGRIAILLNTTRRTEAADATVAETPEGASPRPKG